ncbi:NUDIX hydrolase [candidate division KSB1 bacterium]|nr:NUDIX hydrolase [candidate division KSB1 bacterium]NIR70931.1 NUDIX hydrolase [candidate division KSB1 bacterium]NIS24683.1 NUDIX hydrolase [candidate division KSB1 bacterium]NIT71585.1 NUDIX hydrolase [candidate division KSB1 bacterium]NIU25283.1 NUDIX hydrolase [candidate division KSB1 bacterium]
MQENTGNRSLIYDQSAVIPFRFVENNVKVMLITTRRSRRWIIPKGLIEDDMTAADSAEMEAFEEAGIRGHVYPELIGEYEYQKWGGICQVKVFLMKVATVLEEWPESFRTRKWMTAEEAEHLVREAKLKKMFQQLDSSIRRVQKS